MLLSYPLKTGNRLASNDFFNNVIIFKLGFDEEFYPTVLVPCSKVVSVQGAGKQLV